MFESESSAPARPGCMRGCLTALLVVVLFLIVAFKLLEHRHWRSFVPTGLDVGRIEYQRDESWGIGLPGDNETGLIVYRLPSSTADAVRRSGMAFLQTVGREPRNRGDWHGLYTTWHQTPMLIGAQDSWAVLPKGEAAGTRSATLAEYLDKYGFGIPIDPGIITKIDKALAEPGNYYAFGRIGVFIIIPKESIAVYAYAG